jgi:hypothetical protein
MKLNGIDRVFYPTVLTVIRFVITDANCAPRQHLNFLLAVVGKRGVLLVRFPLAFTLGVGSGATCVDRARSRRLPERIAVLDPLSE